MESAQQSKVTQTLAQLGQLDPGKVAETLLPIVYDELHDLAEGYLRRERKDHTLQPTALVHEAFLRLVDQSRVDWRGRTHFFGVAAQAMKRILIDHARRRRRAKRGGDWRRVALDDAVVPPELVDVDLVALHDALETLAELDPRQARVVELRFLGGLTVNEVAEVLGVSKRTVEGDWTHAKAWLRAELSESDEG